MMNGVREFIKRCFTSVILLGCFGGTYIHSTTLFCIFLGIILMLILLFEWPHLAPPQKPIFWFLTPCYPIFPMGALIGLTIAFRSIDFFLPLYPFLIAWTSDTCGYLAGNLVGKHKMWPSLSPRKTWEGFAGSLVGVVAVHIIMIPHIQKFSGMVMATAPWSTLALSFVMTLISVAGGFFLSYLKRRRGLKDAGTVLPGHGGFLDRFDGVFFVAIATVTLITMMQ